MQRWPAVKAEESTGLALAREATADCLADEPRGSRSRPVNCVCVTLYNEAREPLHRTILSIVAALEHFHRHEAGRGGWSVLCVVADGYDRLAAGVVDFFREYGLIPPAADPRPEDIASFRGTHDCHGLRERLQGSPSTNRLCSRPDVTLEVIVCLKARNRGKLDSHSLFFGRLCTELQPEYCYQVDTGTLLGVESISGMVQRMERDPRVAAVASRILPAVPSETDGFLTAWQFLDLALQKAVLWPFEVATGHLSVIPGQACALRWEAVRGTPAVDRTEAPDTPLHAYLRGQNRDSVLEHIMYLAEDRVLGTELALAKGRTWRMCYAADVTALTDTCGTFEELFRQRRRWLNSTLACRLWLLSRYRSVLRRSDRDRRAKGMLTLGAAGQTLLAIRDFLLPTWFAALTLFLAKLLAFGGGQVGAAFRIGCLGTLAAEVLCALVARHRASRSCGPVGNGIRTALGWAATALFLGWVIAAVPVAEGSILVAGPALALAAARASLPRKAIPALTRRFSSPGFVCPVVSLGMLCLLSAYSYWNLADVSWGTKGLRRVELPSASAARLRRFRNRIFAAWLGTNAVAVALLGIQSAGSGRIVNPVILLSAVIDALIGLIAVASHAWELGRRSATARRRAGADVPHPDHGREALTGAAARGAQ